MCTCTEQCSTHKQEVSREGPEGCATGGEGPGSPWILHLWLLQGWDPWQPQGLFHTKAKAYQWPQGYCWGQRDFFLIPLHLLTVLL